MRLLAFLIFLLFGAFALVARWYFVCQVRQLCVEIPEDVRLQTLELKDDDRVILEGYDQFAFDSTSIEPRLNQNNRLFLDTLAAILHADTSKSLTITGFYREREMGLIPERSYFENLGLARADAIRTLLMKRGIDDNRISLDHGISEDDRLLEPLLFNLYRAGALEDYNRLAFTFENMTYSDANFAFNSAEFKPGAPCMAYLDSVRTYLALNPETTLNVIGHTDSKGTPEYNYELGIRRAEDAREYIRALGVASEIVVASKGETEPVAPNKMPDGNDNPEGRQKNRRVNFVLE